MTTPPARDPHIEASWNHLLAMWAPITAQLAAAVRHVLGCATCQIRFIEHRTTPLTADNTGVIAEVEDRFTPLEACVLLLVAAAKTNCLPDDLAAQAIGDGIAAITQATYAHHTAWSQRARPASS